MKFCTRCGSRMLDQSHCRVCGKPGYKATLEAPAAEYAPAGNLPPFKYVYRVPLLGPLERERRIVVPFSYINGTLIETSSHEDAAHPICFRVWSQQDDPRSGPRDPIVGRRSQPSIRSMVRLRLGSGVERSFVLSQAKLRSRPESRITLIFPAPIERAAHPLHDYAAIAAVDHAAHDFAWSTAHPEIDALRSRLPEEQIEPFADALANHLNGLCRRCLRLFGQHRKPERRYDLAVAHQGASR
ncbi:hypothetical protein IMX07_02755 [bacterium]|jgi:hypothetical protein|nr:hypothetical protein [bacterium]